MPEIDDAELARLQKGQALLDEMLRSPKTKRKAERLVKDLHPDTVISEDYEEEDRKEIAALRKDFKEFIDGERTRKEDDKLEFEFSKLRSDGGFTDEGIDKIKALMKERTIPDPMAAAALYEKLNPPPEPQKPSSFNGLSWGFGAKSEDADTKLLFEDEDEWADRQARAHFAEQSNKT